QFEFQFFLAVANYGSLKSVPSNSTIFKWNNKSRNFFLEHQPLPTIGAYDWTHFTVADYHFLVVANAFTGESTLAFSVLYIWQGDKWVEFQTMEAS
ncbi:unnamed protein product, partial [Lymnaea stagnalis]